MTVVGQMQQDDRGVNRFKGLVRIVDLQEYAYVYEGQAYEYVSKSNRIHPSLKFHGFGRLLHNDGVWYEGEFNHGVKHGYGKYQKSITETETKTREGIWVDGHLLFNHI